MKENIALIQEVHHKKPRLKAEKEAIDMLRKIHLGDIADKRSNQCTNLEKFYVMLIRALMCDKECIMIKTPFILVDTLLDIEKIISNIEILNKDKGIIILDTINNQNNYKGCQCNIIK